MLIFIAMKSCLIISTLFCLFFNNAQAQSPNAAVSRERINKHPVNHFAQSKDPLAKIITVLDKTEQYIKHIKTIAFYSSYKSVMSSMDDSIYTASGQIWLKRIPSDSIFKSIFHIKGETKNGGVYDYFYDGSNSCEVQHKDKKILLINPRLFPNNENNRAKARTAMEPFNYYITDTALKTHLLSSNPQLKMLTVSGQYIIKLTYPVDKHGGKSILELTINNQTFSIDKVDLLSNINGTTFKSTAVYSNIVLNDNTIESEIPIKQAYEGYTIDELRPVKPEAKKTPLLGMAAIEFHYATFDNKYISLASLKGKYVLLDFWESWCGHCIISIPEIQKLYETYRAKGLNVFGVTTENTDKINELIKVNGLKYQTLKADKQMLINYNVSGRPTYVLIDTNGKIVCRSDNGDLDQIIKIINDKLK